MKKFFSIFLSIMILAVFSLGCSLDGDQKQIVSETKPKKLVVWDEIGKTAGIEPALNRFEQQYGIKVEVKEVDITKMLELLYQEGLAGNAADVITMPHTQLGQAVTRGLVMPIKVDKALVSQFNESAINALTYKGVLFGLPRSIETPIFIYNKKLMAQAPITFDELYTFSKEFTKYGYYGFLAPWDNYYFAHGIISGFGGYVFGEKEGIPSPKDLGLNNQGAVQGLEYIQKWYAEGLFPKEIIGESGTQTMDGLFTAGKVAAVMNDPRAIQTYKNATIDIGIAPMPSLPNGKPVKTFLNVKGWFVTPYSKNQGWATKLIEWLTNPENAKIHFEKTGEIPPLKQLISDPMIVNNEEAKAILLQSQNADPIPNLPEMAEVWNPMTKALQLTVTNRLEPQKALDEAVNAIIQRIQANQGK
ncbi:extracellular solute-binding protein [Tepidibacillus fermentans]|uniref:Carbohydrate ABC transporter substrate-binding protein (CUT1 family) n=1 Tax=Tepidibacillus fermentans TaxID=1281767 RepID=A0A4R3KJH0_9BACI|nr:extracellular solute-binding protein [Tepidibacillus fermentans]TCS83818.1 carbohydrate ABC transporter substrate-binding protein (CUT1 family) [Tepidibacillus fermentans]